MDFLNQAFDKAKEIDITELGKEHDQDTEEESFGDVEPQIATDQSYATATPTKVPNDGSCVSASTKIIIGDPRISETKGRKAENGKKNAADNLRYKGGSELSKETKRPRTCRYCTLKGHDSRTCKKKEGRPPRLYILKTAVMFSLFDTVNGFNPFFLLKKNHIGVTRPNCIYQRISKPKKIKRIT
ncbi:hypothetical protein MKW92_032488 [Papaver armeniacum]|nr:hypothetical protein MKW92_032488 [Papaver armeniacum]